jgi:hypothetical protein
MSPKRFIIGLFLTTLLQVAMSLLLMGGSDLIKAHAGFIFTSMLALGLFCVMMYLAARILARSPLTRLYIQLIMIAVFLKMLICLALIVGYIKGFQPADNTFIWPFLFIYISSTIFEVIFLDRVGRQKQTPVS